MTFWVVSILFVLTYLGMAAGGIRGLRIDRSWIAGCAAVLLLFTGVQSPREAADHLDAGALLLLLALMLISAQFDFSGVYAWLNQRLAHYAAPPALAALAITYGVIWLQWRKRWGTAKPVAQEETPVERIYGTHSYLKPLLASLVLLGLFSTNLPREISALLIAALVMISRRVDSRDYVHKVDWNLLLLFAGLFVVTGAALSLPQVAAMASNLAGLGLLPEGVISLASASLLASNLIGNVPFVILLLGVQPEASESMRVGLAIMSTLAGNLLLIGSVVNLIVAESARRQGVPLSFVDFARSGVPVTLLSMGVAGLWLVLGGWLPW